jgi:hypothetical protein
MYIMTGNSSIATFASNLLITYKTSRLKHKCTTHNFTTCGKSVTVHKNIKLTKSGGKRDSCALAY